MPILTEPAEAARVLREARTIAVLGAHHERVRAAFYVPDYLVAQGYRVFPVNPGLVGDELWGQPVRATLAEIDEPVDVVDVFRNSRYLPEHLDDFLAMQPRPRVVWLQLGVRHDAVARQLAEAGIEVVQDRCMLADHRRFAVGRVG